MIISNLSVEGQVRDNSCNETVKFLLLTLLLALPLPALALSSLTGDVNGDGTVNITDLNATISIILDGPSHPVEEGDWVDLGLPSGTIWATRNVGASTPEDYGDYFAWGETSTKSVYDLSSYKWCNGSFTLTKYNTINSHGAVDYKTELDPADDAACALYPAGRMPSWEQIMELVKSCSWQWTRRNGVYGQLVNGPNGNMLFLPAAGYRAGSRLYYDGMEGYYCSRTIFSVEPGYANSLYFDSENCGWHYDHRHYGRTVRAVCGVTTAADVNGDGTVNITDINAIISIILDNPSHLVCDSDYVDMGLPTGTLWATRNVGASSPEDYGDYFSWGETVPKDYYDWSTYKWCNGSGTTLTKYCTKRSYGANDYKTELDTSDDAAWAHYPDGRMPSLEQIQELVNSCSWQWTQRNGVYGQLVTGPNGNALFLPAAGRRVFDLLLKAGLHGGYWSRTIDPYQPDYGCDLRFFSDEFDWGSFDRDIGRTVRAVRVS